MSSSDTSMPAPRQSPVMKIVAAVAAIAVLAFGASAVAKHGSSTPSAAPAGQRAPQGFAPQGGPGAFSPVTGATLAKLKSAVAAQYPGTIERAMKLPDDSYEVHVIQSGGQEVHVLVSRTFTVTGTEQRDFRGRPPAGQAAPNGRAAPDDGAAPSGTPTGTQS
jgi:hypothetical protein